MRFLLTNDDGIEAAGLALLADVCSGFGELTVVAPDCEQSGVGHRVNTRQALTLSKRALSNGAAPEAYALSGTPADCTRVGLRGLDLGVDWVISGLNHGGNMGVDINMSGTVAAAREGAILGAQAIAISQVLSMRHPPDPKRMHDTTARVLRELLKRPLPPGQLYNVNLPFAPESDSPEIVLCGPDPSPHDVQFSLGEAGYQYSGKFLNRGRQIGLDVDMVFSGKIAVSVLTIV